MAGGPETSGFADLRLGLAEAVARPDTNALLLDESNRSFGRLTIREAVEQDECFCVEVDASRVWEPSLPQDFVVVDDRSTERNRSRVRWLGLWCAVSVVAFLAVALTGDSNGGGTLAAPGLDSGTSFLVFLLGLQVVVALVITLGVLLRRSRQHKLT